MHEITSDQVDLVKDLIHEYLQKNRFFNEEKIVSFIDSRLSKSAASLNRRGIQLILQSLVDTNYIKLRSKLTRTEILENSNRHEIYAFIKENPGVHFFKIVKHLNLTIAVASWHLKMLVEFQFINQAKIDNHDVYYEKSVPQQRYLFSYYMQKRKSKKIIDFLKDKEEGCSISQLARNIGMARNTVKKYLEALTGLKIITIVDIANKKVCKLNNEIFLNLKI